MIAVLDAPSNLGLRMPAPGVVPGCYKLAGAIRDQCLLDRLGARDAVSAEHPARGPGRTVGRAEVRVGAATGSWKGELAVRRYLATAVGFFLRGGMMPRQTKGLT